MQKLNRDKVRGLYWNKNYTVGQIADKLSVSVWSLYDFMNKNKISRRNYSEASFLFNKDKPQFKIKENLTGRERELKIAGLMLYWAEGTLKGSTVDFANSNPGMVRLFLNFLREICGVREERLRVYLYAHSGANISKLKKHWHKTTKIPTAQFTKPYLREGNPNLSRRKMLYGLIHVRYNDKKLLKVIDTWIKEYSCSF